MVQVIESTVINAPAEQVWAIVRDFNGHDRWHPAVTDSKLESGRATDMVGAVRSFHLSSGEHLREQLLSLSDHDLTMTYCIVESPIPLLNYVAHVRLIPVTDGNATYWEWQSSFQTPPGQEQELAAMVGNGVYREGFEAIRALFEAKPPDAQHAVQAHSASQQLAAPAMASRQASLSSAASAAVLNRSSTASPITCAGVVVAALGGPEQLVIADISVPPPARGEVRLRHTAIGINYIDVYSRTGQLNLLNLPGIPGLEAAAVITDLGEDCGHWQVGDRVAYATLPPGAYCEVRNLPADRLVALPDDITDEQAAGALVKGLTAHFLLHQVHRLQAGETALIHAAAGGVGLLVCQWAKRLGARVFGTVGSQTKAQVAKDNGCDEVINYSQTDFTAVVNELTQGRGVDLIIDGIGQQTFAGSLQALRNGGHLISYGQASGNIGLQDIDALAAKSVTLSRPNFNHYTDTHAKLTHGAGELFPLVRNGALQVRIDQRFGLAEAPRAHRWLEGRQSIGSNLLIP